MRSGVERGAERNVHERDTQSCGALFFGPVSVNIQSLLTWDEHWIIIVDIMCYFGNVGPDQVYVV